MPTLAEAKGIVRARFASSAFVADGLVAYDNARFNKPDPSITWIRFNVLPTSSLLITIGGTKRWRHEGLFIAQLFGPQEAGDGGLDVLHTAIFTAFSSKKIDDVTYRTVGMDSIGVSDAWWQVNVTCPWHAKSLHGKKSECDRRGGLFGEIRQGALSDTAPLFYFI
jgi:hypothetical protein